MPRISGRSSLTTESRIRCSPRRRTVCFWSFGRSITLRTWVTLSWVIVDPHPATPRLVAVDLFELGRARGRHARLRRRHRVEHRPGRHLVELAPSEPRDLLGAPQALEPGHGGVHDVDRVRRAERLRQDVLDPGALDDGAHRAAGDDAGPRRRGLEQHDAGAVLARSPRAGSWCPSSGPRTSCAWPPRRPSGSPRAPPWPCRSPTPTRPAPSPTTTSAVKLNRRPPLTTLATRLIETTRSS